MKFDRLGLSPDPHNLRGAMKTEPDRSGSTLTAGSGLRLGVAGFRHADLFNPHRLRDLTEIFEREVERADPELMVAWRAYGSSPDSTPPKQVSDLLVRMGPHLSRFVARLFGVVEELQRIRTATRNEDPIFRFKVDFLRRRAQITVQ